MDSKASQGKHKKYIDFYDTLKSNDTEYWGLGIENETYIMFKKLEHVPKTFILNNQVRERYSVNYWTNYKPEELSAALSTIPKNIYVPSYMNAYQFQNTDMRGEHEYLYTKERLKNPRFAGKNIHEIVTQRSPVITELFKKHMIYDGDTFEFTTFDFYKTNVRHVVNELIEIKAKFINELNRMRIFKDTIVYPPYNHGFAKFQSNPNNIGICNNGTYHINITLPTELNNNGEIKNLEEFKQKHANAIRAIQWVEPLIVALYGSPDILHVINPSYTGGSQRLGFSRYIGLGTYDTEKMEKGKLLNTFDYKNTESYFAELHKNSPYIPPETTGYDFNYNKFTRHGIELRILDYFPEEHLESIINLLILLCQHSVTTTVPDPRSSSKWTSLVCDSIKHGSDFKVAHETYMELYKVLGAKSCWWSPFKIQKTPYNIMNNLGSVLYSKYRRGDICKKLSPSMPPLKFIDFNAEMKSNFRKTLLKN